MIPQNISGYLSQVYLSIGFSKKEIKNNLKVINDSFEIIILEKVLKTIPLKKQLLFADKLKMVKNPEEIIIFLAKFFSNNVDFQNFRKIYVEELEKILEPILKPLKESCTPEQLVKLQVLTAKYF